jgi:hypothetical protein
MRQPNPFRWRHFEGEIILLGVRWVAVNDYPLICRSLLLGHFANA